MQKKFNDTGLCVPGRHYMVDISKKIKQIIRLVEDGAYFTINRPRQFGKTTTLSLLSKTLNQQDNYLALSMSFKGIDTVTYQHQEAFIEVFLDMLKKEFIFLRVPELAERIAQQQDHVTNMPRLSELFTTVVNAATPEKNLVLMIDEVDKSSKARGILRWILRLI